MTKLGKLWTGAVAYVSLLVGAGLSVAGNLADTYRTRGADVDGLDKVMAAGWPILVLLAIEMFVSPRWSSTRMFQVWRWLGCLGVGGMAMVVSWTHLHDLMASRGQLPAVTVLGPLAIDGMAIMATGLILSTRVRGHADTGIGQAFADMVDTLATGRDVSTNTVSGPRTEHTPATDTQTGRDRWADLVAPDTDTPVTTAHLLGERPPAVDTDVASLNGMATWAQWSYADDRAVQDLTADIMATQPLPQRTRTPAGQSYPQEFADMVASWEPDTMKRAELVRVAAGQFDVSARTARRWLAAVLNEPTSGA